MEKRDILKRTIIISCIIVIIDQITKILVSKFISTNSITVIPNFIEFSPVENTGIAFSLNKGNLKNIIISLVIIIFIINYIFKQRQFLNIFTLNSLDIILAGGMSNLIDRILKGAVIDFIKIGNFPVFNLADCCIVIGWALFAYYILKFEVKKNV